MSTALPHTACRLIRQKLLSGELGPGSRVSERALAIQLGISRAPVREAIAQMLSEGLLVKYPPFGTFVRLPDRREVDELFDLRELLECYAAAQAARIAQPGHLEAMARTCERVREVALAMRAGQGEGRELGDRLIAADYEFHTLILQAADNRQVMRIVDNFHILADFFSHYSRQRPQLKDVARIYRQHLRILRCIQRRDSQGARLCMADQIAHSRRIVLAALDRLPGGPPGAAPDLARALESAQAQAAPRRPRGRPRKTPDPGT